MLTLLKAFFFVFHYIDSYIVFSLALLMLWYSYKVETKYTRIILFIGALIVVTPHVVIYSNFIFFILINMTLSS